jgi:prepilin-type N-terminal cleavage/methylation domain-containing protein
VSRPVAIIAARRGFTLTELLVAVAVLLVVIVATARIFSTVSKVTGLGEANADLLQTAQTIERQLRDDIARLSRDGFLAIQSIEVANDVNGPSAPLLNSALPATATVRADRLVFFATGTQSSSMYSGSDDPVVVTGTDAYWPVKQAGISRVYWGPGIQLRNAKPLEDLSYTVPLETGLPLTPWTFDAPGDGPDATMVRWDTGALGTQIICSQPGAREWTLARQAVLLADDGSNGFLRYFNRQTDPKNSTASIFVGTASPTGTNYDPGINSSRVDIAASTIEKVRQQVSGFGANSIAVQRANILAALGVPGQPIPFRFPRAEKLAPSMDRIDQMLTNSTIANGASSFIVEWTWADGTGRVRTGNGAVADPTPAQVNSGDEWVGLVLPSNVAANSPTAATQPWFGFPDASRGVNTLSSLPAFGGGTPSNPVLGAPLYPANIEGSTPVVQVAPGVRLYQAVFGLNQTRPTVEDPTNGGLAAVDPSIGYTPWPSALRFTVLLHDPAQRFVEGRVFQFVIELPAS